MQRKVNKHMDIIFVSFYNIGNLNKTVDMCKV